MGPNLASMAWRNLWRNRRRTLLTLSSISFGVMLAVIFTGGGDAQWSSMIRLAARLGGGHVTLQHPEFLDTPTLSRTVSDVSRLRETASRDPDVERAITRIAGQVMLSTAGQTYGAGFIALDPEVEDETTLSLLEALSEGEMFSSAQDRGIILGKRLAENLDVSMGRKVVYTLTDKDGEIVRDVARVSGIIFTGTPTVDGALCLFPIGTMSEVLGYGPEESTQVAVFLRDHRKADQVAARLAQAVGPGAAALTWKQTQPDLSGFITMKVVGAQLMEVVIMILVAAGIFNTLFVSVMERVREFGIMMAIGFTPRKLFSLVMLESLWLGLVGLVGAVLITAGPYYYMATTGIDISGLYGGETPEVAGLAITPVLYARIYPESALIIAVAALLATLLSGLYPAWHAGRLRPVDSIRLV